MGKLINISIKSRENITVSYAVTGVSVSPSTVSVEEGQTTQLTRTITPPIATDQTGVWSSSNETLATVDQNGLVTAIADGSVTITYTTNDGGLTSNSAVTVENPPVPVTAVTVTPDVYTLSNGATTQLAVAFTPSNANDQTGVWSSDTPAVATVDANGLVTNAGVDSGTATITYTSNDGSFTDTCVITAQAVPGVFAFPSAYGAGASITGGRGGKVCHVDTLTWDTAVTYHAGTDSYSGGFYNMFYELDIPVKQIVFTVSGVISVPVQTSLNFGTGRTNQANCTINGQSAPGKIVFETSFFQIKNIHNCIWRYCSFSYTGVDVGFPYYGEVDALYLTDDTGLSIEDVVFDHCSFFYGNDECLDISSEDSNAPILNITVQNCLIAGASKGMMLGNANSETQATACYNAYVDINYRTPNLYGNSVSRLDAYNNFIENPFNRWIRITGAGDFNVQNYYVQTNYFTGDNAGRHCVQYIDTAECSIHSSGNIKTGQHDTPTSPDFDDIWWCFLGSSSPYEWQDLIPASIKENTPMTLIGRAGTIHAADDLDTLVLPFVGNNARLDADGTVISDTYALDDFYLDLAVNPASASTTNRYPATKYPSVLSGTPYTSTLKDGIPDTWRTANMSGESHDDVAPSGYTWIEEFHNEIEG